VAPTPSAIRDAVCRLLGDDALADRMGAAGRRRFEERYTSAAFAGRYAKAMAGVGCGAR
jgi:glycosyltransferase involved in cell wall biosynthesis